MFTLAMLDAELADESDEECSSNSGVAIGFGLGRGGGSTLVESVAACRRSWDIDGSYMISSLPLMVVKCLFWSCLTLSFGGFAQGTAVAQGQGS